jgi:hypothetical protein
MSSLDSRRDAARFARKEGSLRALVVVLGLAACGNPLDTSDANPPDFDMSMTMPGGDGGIVCGTSDCLLGADLVCCLDGALRYCAPVGACSSGTPIYCDGPEDCPGAVCCQPMGAQSIECRVQCSGSVICHGDGYCPASAPHCCDGKASGGYGSCAPAC